MKQILIALVVCFGLTSAMANGERFCIAEKRNAAQILVDANDWQSVVRAANDLGDDVWKVSGVTSEVKSLTSPPSRLTSHSIIVGTLCQSFASTIIRAAFPFPAIQNRSPFAIAEVRPKQTKNAINICFMLQRYNLFP